MDLGSLFRALAEMPPIALITLAVVVFVSILFRRFSIQRFKQEIKPLPVVDVIYTIKRSLNPIEQQVAMTWAPTGSATNFQLGTVVRYHVDTTSNHGIKISRRERKVGKPHILGTAISIEGDTMKVKGRCRMHNGSFIPENVPFDLRLVLNINGKLDLLSKKRHPMFSQGRIGFLADVEQI